MDLSTVELASYRSQLGLVLQDDFLFDGTIRENICSSPPGATDEEVEEAARRAYVCGVHRPPAGGTGSTR